MSIPVSPHGGDKAFELATSVEKNSLVNFAIESNDVYKTRTAKREVAEEVFDLVDSQFKYGYVEKLVDSKTDAIIGFYSLKKSRKNGSIELGHLFVRPDLLKKGYGKILFARALEKAKSLDKNSMHWISDPDAEGFYLKMGAYKTGTDENLLNPKVPVPLFEIKI